MHPNTVIPQETTTNSAIIPDENIILKGIEEKIKQRYDVKTVRIYNDKEMAIFLFPPTIMELGTSYASIVEGFYTNKLGKGKDKNGHTVVLCKAWVMRHVKMVSLKYLFKNKFLLNLLLIGVFCAWNSPFCFGAH